MGLSSWGHYLIIVTGSSITRCGKLHILFRCSSTSLSLAVTACIQSEGARAMPRSPSRAYRRAFHDSGKESAYRGLDVATGAASNCSMVSPIDLGSPDHFGRVLKSCKVLILANTAFTLGMYSQTFSGCIAAWVVVILSIPLLAWCLFSVIRDIWH
jgi:hypothetical protein